MTKEESNIDFLEAIYQEILVRLGCNINERYTRKRQIVTAKEVFIFFARNFVTPTPIYQEIANIVGYHSHSTAVHSYNRIVNVRLKYNDLIFLEALKCTRPIVERILSVRAEELKRELFGETHTFIPN